MHRRALVLFPCLIPCHRYENSQLSLFLIINAMWQHLRENPRHVRGAGRIYDVRVTQLLRQLPDFTITLCGKPISPIPVAKDLGVFLDQCLSYDEHILKTVASCMNKLIQINRIKRLFDKETLLLVITSFVFSRLFYCSSVWSNTSATNSHKLQLVQNFAARIILGLRKYDHISAGLRSLRWLNVKLMTYGQWCSYDA